MGDKDKAKSEAPKKDLAMSFDELIRIATHSIHEHGKELDAMPVAFTRGEGIDEVYDERDSAAGGLDDVAEPDEKPAAKAKAAPPADDEELDQEVKADQLAEVLARLDKIDQKPKASRADELASVASSLETLRRAGAVVDFDALKAQFPDLPIKRIIEDE